MEANFQRALALVLKHEGGFSNHAADPGGATNKGITLETFRRYVKPGGTVADLKAITDTQVAQVYKAHYWNAVKGDQLPSGVDYACFDFAVNSGPSRAIKYLQRILLVPQDGIIGPQTLGVLDRAKPEHVIEVLCAERLKFLQGLSHWSTFGKGWGRRVADVQVHALAMVMDGRLTPASSPKPAPQPPAPSPAPKSGQGGIIGLLIAAAIGAAVFIISVIGD
jgi:lysozyme family protein